MSKFSRACQCGPFFVYGSSLIFRNPKPNLPVDCGMNMTQAQIEALVDLLVYASATDALFSLRESDWFEQDLESLPWKSNIGIQGFVNASYARVNATETPESKRAYLQKLCAAFNTLEHRKAAFREIEKLLWSDGVKPAESDFLVQLHQGLNLA